MFPFSYSHVLFSSPRQNEPFTCTAISYRALQSRFRIGAIFFITLLAFLMFDADGARTSGQEPPKKTSAWGQWWHGPYATGDWLGGRTFLEDHGLKFGGESTSIYYGVPTKDLQQNSVFCYNLVLNAELDFGKMLGLQGLSGRAEIQWETGERFRDDPGSGIAFSPIAFIGYWNWRLKPIVLKYVTPELFGVKEFLTLAGGWSNPYDYFFQQSAANLFKNYAFWSGVFVANGVLLDGNYVSWGGYAKVNPSDWAYLQAGLWAAVPDALDWHNRGVYFALAQPPQRNGLFFMGETGVTPKIGASRLPGKYAFGSYYWSLSCPSFIKAPPTGLFGFYWQADQMLYREPSIGPVPNPSQSMSKDTKAPQASFATSEKLSSQGLYAFGMMTYVPHFNNALPFFFRTGLVYKGLIPSRDQDDLGIGFAFGSYSRHKIPKRVKNQFVRQTNEAVLEVDYRFQINRWLYAQPFVEYIIRPNGDGLSKDALVLGIAANIKF